MTGRRELQSETEIEAGGASREKWVANVKNMLVANTKTDTPTKAEAIVQTLKHPHQPALLPPARTQKPRPQDDGLRWRDRPKRTFG